MPRPLRGQQAAGPRKRTTVVYPKDLDVALREYSARMGVHMIRVQEEALREYLQKRSLDKPESYL
jgi:hypothetical protein